MRGEPIEQQSIRGIAERYDSRVAANGGDRERITYAIVDYHRAVDDVSAGNTVQAVFTVGPVFLPGLSILPFRHPFSTCPRSLASHFVLITALQSSSPMFLRRLISNQSNNQQSTEQ